MKISGSDMFMASQRRAFTLIELVIAGIIAAMVLGAVTLALSQLGKARNLSRDRVEAYQRAATAIEALRTDVSSTLRSDDLFDCRFLLTQRNTRSHGYDRSELLVFNTSLRPIRTIEYQGEGLEYETAFRVEEDELGTALWRRRDPVPDDVPDGGGMAEPVADGIVALRIEASKGDGAWQEEWDSDYDGIPKLVRVTVTATGAPLGGEPTRNTPEVTLSTMVALDRVVPPKSEEPKDDAAAAAAAAGADAAGANGAVPGAGLSGGGGVNVGTPNVGGGGATAPGGPGAGRPGGNGGGRPGGGGPGASGGRGQMPPPAAGGGGRTGGRR